VTERVTSLFSGDYAVQVVKTVDGYWNIQLKNVQKQDEGEYFCVATNSYAIPASRTSVSAKISVGGIEVYSIFFSFNLNYDFSLFIQILVRYPSHPGFVVTLWLKVFTCD
jgi:hypothetical protein